MNERTQRFSGGVFSQELEGGRSGADISLSGQAVQATTPEGHLFSVPYRELSLSLGGNSGRMWFCRNRDKSVTIFCEQAGFAEALRSTGSRELSAQLAQVEESARASSRRTWAWALGITLALGFVVLAGVLGVRQLGRLSVHALPTSVDVQLGKLALQHSDLGGTVSDDPKLKQAVQKVFDRLDKAERSPFAFQVRVVESSQVNAFALPGGPIVVFTGLLKEAQNAEQLAGVLAHEMAHITRRHHMQRIAQSVGVIAAIQLLFGDVSGVMAVAVELLQAGTINSYSRDAEHEADMEGLKRMHKARLDGGAMADFFALLEKKGGDLPTSLSWLGDHPQLAQRVKDVRAEVAKQPASKLEPLELDWAEVQKRAGKRE